ncbi:MAG: DUF2119 domain-containing protein [Candidatus Nezhaarchaeota archaeon]|nr:DUF2119 domain-containing protein [Candidatus Nezhaarchaeota archaeon]
MLSVKVYELPSGIEGPVRLYVGGLHGREGRVTAPVLRTLLSERPPPTGKLVVVPALCCRKKHVSTLREAYYETEEGVKLLRLLSTYSPHIYVELHCYRASAYRLLTDPVVRARRGAPPLLDVGSGVLIGAASPKLYARFSPPLSIVIELPCRGGGVEEALRILRIVRDSSEVEEALRRLEEEYPEQARRIKKYLEAYVDKPVGAVRSGGAVR